MMNDFVLRGFCETCGFPVYLNEEKAYHTTNVYSPITVAFYSPCKGIKPVWFLSPKQMKIISDSEEYRNFWGKMPDGYRMTDEEIFVKFIAENPFLVARLLVLSLVKKNSKKRRKSFGAKSV